MLSPQIIELEQKLRDYSLEDKQWLLEQLQKQLGLKSQEIEEKDPIHPLELHKTYHLPTPYDVFGVGEVLMQELNNKSHEI